MNVAAVFGARIRSPKKQRKKRKTTSMSKNTSAKIDAHDVDGNRADVSSHRACGTRAGSRGARWWRPGTLEEEEIEEEEADLSHYVEELEEDAAFEELEEETHAAGEHEHPAQEIAASAEVAGVDAVPFSADAISSEEVDVAAADEVDEEAEDEAELDQAQAEAEAALAAEARRSWNDGGSG